MAERRLPDSELDVLSALCRAGEATTAALREALEPQRPMTHGALATLLARLEAKGMVTKRKGTVGKAFVYAPSDEGREAFRPFLQRLSSRLFGGDRVSFVASLLESKPPTPQELEELQALVDRLRAERRRRGAK